MYEYSMMSNQWTETNTPMTQRRWGHECMKLSEDQILVIGGHDGNGHGGVTRRGTSSPDAPVPRGTTRAKGQGEAVAQREHPRE